MPPDTRFWRHIWPLLLSLLLSLSYLIEGGTLWHCIVIIPLSWGLWQGAYIKPRF